MLIIWFIERFLKMKNEVVIHSENDLQSRIYTIRGFPVMLDFDLAEIYGYEVKRPLYHG